MCQLKNTSYSINNEGHRSKCIYYDQYVYFILSAIIPYKAGKKASISIYNTTENDYNHVYILIYTYDTNTSTDFIQALGSLSDYWTNPTSKSIQQYSKSIQRYGVECGSKQVVQPTSEAKGRHIPTL